MNEKSDMRICKYSDAVSEALCQCMAEDDRVVIMGIGVDDPVGIFGTTRRAADLFGPQRVIEMPACENAMTGMAIGMALNGMKPVIVHARNDFSFLGLDQVCNYAAKWKYMFGGATSVPIVIRNIVGKGWGQGATHSQYLAAIYAYFPGLQVFSPSTPYDVKGIIASVLRNDIPAIIFEHRRVYDSIGHVPEELYSVEAGSAKVVREGDDISIVASSLSVADAFKAAIALEQVDINAEVIDLRCIQPLDRKTILDSVGKTGRLLCVDSGWCDFGVPAEVLAIVGESPVCHKLKIPARRIGMASCPAPVSFALESVYYADHKAIYRSVLDMLDLPQVEYEWPEEIEVFKGPY